MASGIDEIQKNIMNDDDTVGGRQHQPKEE